MLSEKVKSISRRQFPPDFAWGAATAAYQIEGAVAEDGRKPSIWDVFSHTSGKTANGDTGDVACDHYHRYKEDVALMRDLGFNAYRFSVAWPRIIPDGRGKVNQKGLDFYDRLVDELLANDIQPYVTLYHWDLPVALHEAGGWTNRDTAQAYAEYAETVVKRLGDRVRSWITFNEPWVAAVNGYITGEHAPGETNLLAGVQAAHNMLVGHGLAVPLIRQHLRRPEAEVGITLSLTYVEPGNHTTEAKDLAFLVDVFSNRFFLDPLFLGHYPHDMPENLINPLIPAQEGDAALIAQPLDFVGLNYYFRTLPVKIEDFHTMQIKMHQPKESQYTAMGWEVHPDGLYHLLKRVHEDYNPAKIYVTENGAAFADTLTEENGQPAVHDPERRQYLIEHFQATQRALSEGVPLAGYFVWSLYDNFEWAFGTNARFGVVYLDYATQRRIIKDSGYWYQQFLKER